MVDLWVEIVALAALIGLSAFFSGLEVALVGTRDSKVNQLKEKKVRGAEALYKLKSNPGWMMSSVNLGNNLVNVGSSAFATSVALRLFGDSGLAIAVGIMTLLILVFGEITPKTYCNANATKVSLRCAGILLVFSYALWPVVKLFETITKFIVKLTGSSYHTPPITEDEIRGIVEQGLKDKALEKEETELVHGALRFDDITVKNLVTPRTKMFTLPEKTLLLDALPLINESTHSRIPVYGKNVDQITGFVHVRDILTVVVENYRTRTLKELARSPLFVSTNQSVNSLLKSMRKQKIHIAIVVDEYGGVEGLVTLEDLIETIVGDIEDEIDETTTEFYTVSDKAVVVHGDTKISKVNSTLGSRIPESKNYVTINGLLHERLRAIPRTGDSVNIGDVQIKVEKTMGHQVARVRISKVS